LQRSSKVVWDEAKGATSVSSFSKATFSLKGSDATVDISDPNFWEKVNK
jgi:hypothetical protein